jgi:hypothetical protein
MYDMYLPVTYQKRLATNSKAKYCLIFSLAGRLEVIKILTSLSFPAFTRFPYQCLL